MGTSENVSILPTSDVASLLGVTAHTVRQWVKDGKLASFQTQGGLHLFTMEEIERFRLERDARQ